MWEMDHSIIEINYKVLKLKTQFHSVSKWKVRAAALMPHSIELNGLLLSAETKYSRKTRI